MVTIQTRQGHGAGPGDVERTVFVEAVIGELGPNHLADHQVGAVDCQGLVLSSCIPSFIFASATIGAAKPGQRWGVRPVAENSLTCCG